MEVLKGKPVADALAEKTAEKAEKLLSAGILPTLAIVRVGEKDSDIAYENSAVKRAESLGIRVEKFILEEQAAEEDVIEALQSINKNKKIHGVLLFRPLPPHMDEERVRNYLAAEKDIDGITDRSLAGIFTGSREGFPPCTAEAAMEILKYYKVPLAGRRAVVIGRSLVVGKPAAMLLMEQNATVTICHSRTGEERLKEYCQAADIIICAAGRIKTLTAAHVDGRQVVIDVGINFDEEGKMCGDADFEGIMEADGAAAMTPVPGGVGNVTTALLLYHVAEAADLQKKQ